MATTEDRLKQPEFELNVGYSISEQTASLKLRIPKGFFSEDRGNPFGMVKKWLIRRRATRDARLGMPDLTRTPPQPSATEEEILHQAQERFDEIKTELLKKNEGLVTALYGFRPVPFSAETARATVRNTLELSLQRYQEHVQFVRKYLDEARSELDRAQKELKAFADDKGLSERQQPTFSRPVEENVAVLGILAFMEAMFGMVLFWESQDYGLLGGIVIALAVGVANILLGLLFGVLAVHHILYGKKWQRNFGFGFAVVNGLTALVMNLVVAHYREGGEVSLDNLMPQSALSVVMLVLGMGVWIFAAIKGHRDFSPGLPGHRELWNEVKKWEHEFETAQIVFRSLPTIMRRDAQEQTNHVRAILNEILARHEARRAIVEAVLNDTERVKSRLEAHQAVARKAADVLIKVYREANYAIQKKNGDVMLEYPAPELSSPGDDFQKAEAEARETLGLIKKNVEQIQEFRMVMEREIINLVSNEISKVVASVEKGDVDGERMKRQMKVPA
jgi:hypothetical protein